jgi:23S rRNA pseudouridine2605 synthase
VASFDSLSDEGGEGTNHWYRVTLAEGRNREVRRLFEALNMTVSRLIRVRYGPVEMPRSLKRGMWAEMSEAETVDLMRGLGIRAQAAPKRPPREPGRVAPLAAGQRAPKGEVASREDARPHARSGAAPRRARREAGK